MFKKLTILCLLLLSCCLVFAQTFGPKPNTLVTDSTNTLSAEQRASLESKLVAFNDSTSTQIAVVIIKSVGNYDINQYGAALIRAWGIGQKGKNNGIVILVAINDRKVSINTGYGAEGAVPDIITHQIIENDIKPNFKQNQYYEGLDAATNSLILHMKGEYKADAKPQRVNNQDDSGGIGSIIMIVVIVVVVVIFIFRGRGGGGGGHIIGGRGGASPFWWFLAGSALGSSGRNDGGGFFGGGSSSGGGNDSGGGGFGGFGGGDSGGGGSSGSW